MSKEVKRFYIMPGSVPALLSGDPAYTPMTNRLTDVHTVPLVLASDYDALLAERDDLLRQVETLTDWYSNSLNVINEVTAALPGVQYMDPPDGGDVSVPEQVRRMAKDAERYRFLMRELGGSVSQVVMGSPVFSNEDVDAAIDAALQGEQP